VPIRRLKRPQSLTEVVLHDIREAIIQGKIELGSQLSELRLSESLGVSKTPVREALQELRRNGLVQITPKSGTVVFLPNEKELSDIFDLRLLLETGSAERLFERNFEATQIAMTSIVEQMKAAVTAQDYKAYRNLDSEFHKAIVAGSDNAMIIDAYAPLSRQIDALRNRGLEVANVIERSLVYHQKLLDLLKTGDSKSFQDALAVHIANSKRDYASWLEQFSPGSQERRGGRSA
jgi:DNA-binding GntR family transcriptional regulator